MGSPEFVLAEYHEKWEYLRHTERVENWNIRLYFAIVAAVVSFQYREVRSFTAMLEKDVSVVPLVFVVVYSVFLLLLLLFMKRNYVIYNDRLNDIERLKCEYVPKLPRWRPLTVFRLRVSLVSIIMCAIVFLIALQLSKSFWGSLIISIESFAVTILLTYFPAFRH